MIRQDKTGKQVGKSGKVTKKMKLTKKQGKKGN